MDVSLASLGGSSRGGHRRRPSSGGGESASGSAMVAAAPDPASLYPVVHDLSEYEASESNGGGGNGGCGGNGDSAGDGSGPTCCCLDMDPDGSVNIGGFSLQDLNMLPMGGGSYHGLNGNGGNIIEGSVVDGNGNRIRTASEGACSILSSILGGGSTPPSSPKKDGAGTGSSPARGASAAAAGTPGTPAAHPGKELEGESTPRTCEIHSEEDVETALLSRFNAEGDVDDNTISSDVLVPILAESQGTGGGAFRERSVPLNDVGGGGGDQTSPLRQTKSEDDAVSAACEAAGSPAKKSSGKGGRQHRRGLSLGLILGNKASAPAASAAGEQEEPSERSEDLHQHHHQHAASDSLLRIDHASTFTAEAIAEALHAASSRNGSISFNRNHFSTLPARRAFGSGHRTKTFEDQYVLTRMVFRCDNSQVWETVHRESGQRYCVKIIEDGKRDGMEVHRLAAAQGSPNVVKLVEAVYGHDGGTGRPTVHCVMEYAAGGNLLTHVVQRGGGAGLSEKETRVIIKSLLQGVRYLHGNSMCHLDLQPSNILLDDSPADGMKCKICDFGSATMMSSSGGESGVCGPGGIRRSLAKSLALSSYAAPELVPVDQSQRQYVTSQADMWSVGVIMHFCLFGCLPPALEKSHQPTSTSPPAAPFASHYHNASSVIPMPMISNSKVVSRASKQLLSGLLHVDPVIRFTAVEALQHSWFKSAYYDVVYQPSSVSEGQRPRHAVANRPANPNSPAALNEKDRSVSIDSSSSGKSGGGERRRPFLRYLTDKVRSRSKSLARKRADRKEFAEKNNESFTSLSNDCSTTEATNATSMSEPAYTFLKS